MTSKTYKPLDDLIDSSGLKKKAVAEKLDIDYSTFYNWRTNPKLISAVDLGKLSEAIGVEFTTLFKVVKKFDTEHDKLASKPT